jgi:hypothetical protein
MRCVNFRHYMHWFPFKMPVNCYGSRIYAILVFGTRICCLWKLAFGEHGHHVVGTDASRCSETHTLINAIICDCQELCFGVSLNSAGAVCILFIFLL